jgi:hypothetical protein
MLLKKHPQILQDENAYVCDHLDMALNALSFIRDIINEEVRV